MIEYPISILEKEKERLFKVIRTAPTLEVSQLQDKIDSINFVIDFLELSKVLNQKSQKL